MVHKSGKTHLNADGLTRAHTDAPVEDPCLSLIENCEIHDSPDSESSQSDTWEEGIAEIDAVSTMAQSVCDAGLALETLTSKCSVCT